MIVLVEFLGQVVGEVGHQCRGVGGACLADLVRIAAENLDDTLFLGQQRSACDGRLVAGFRRLAQD